MLKLNTKYRTSNMNIPRNLGRVRAVVDQEESTLGEIDKIISLGLMSVVSVSTSVPISRDVGERGPACWACAIFIAPLFSQYVTS